MFKAVINDASHLLDIFAVSNEVFDEIVLNLDSEGIKMIANDRAGVVILSLKIEKGLFKEYACDKETKIAFNMQEFYKILKLFGGETTLSLEGDYNLVLSQKSPFNKILKLRLFEPDVKKEEKLETFQLYNFKFPIRVELKTSAFESIIKDCGECDNVLFDVDTERIRFYGKSGLMMTEYDFRLEKDNDLLLLIEAEKPCKTMLNNDYLQRILKACRVSENMRIEMETDYPIRFSFAGDNILMVFFVAPTVSEGGAEEMEGKFSSEVKEQKEEARKITKKGKMTIIEE